MIDYCPPALMTVTSLVTNVALVEQNTFNSHCRWGCWHTSIILNWELQQLHSRPGINLSILLPCSVLYAQLSKDRDGSPPWILLPVGGLHGSPKVSSIPGIWSLCIWCRSAECVQKTWGCSGTCTVLLSQPLPCGDERLVSSVWFVAWRLVCWVLIWGALGICCSPSVSKCYGISF